MTEGKWNPGKAGMVILIDFSTALEMTAGIVSGFQERSQGKERSRMMAITADFAKGSSGAPVVDGSGAVVGIARITEPVYYKNVHGAGTLIQMIWKCCTPSTALIELTQGPEE